MIFSINKLIIRIIIAVIVIFFILSFIKTGQKHELQQNLDFPQKTESSQHDSKWLKDYKYVDYKITTTFRKEPYNFELIEAEGKHSLIKISDLVKMLYGEYTVSGDFITITVYNTSIKLKLNDPHLWGYVVIDGVKKRALYKIPYPPIEVNGEIYVPVRSVLRAFNMGVVFTGDKIFVGQDVPRNDASLIFEKFVKEEE
ncbi:MAG: hypothetical protein ACPLSX_00345 [Arcobacter sp.]